MKQLVSALLFPLVLACGCSSGDDASSGDASSRDAFIASFCDALTPCCAKGGFPTDGRACRGLIGGFATGTYDAAQGQRCLDEVAARKGDPDFCSGTSAVTPACELAIASQHGSVQPGEECSRDTDCALAKDGRVHCASIFANGATSEKCQVVRVGAEGSTPCVAEVSGNVTSYYTQSFAAEGYSCDRASGLYCNSETVTCMKLGAVGDDCSGRAKCGADAKCDSKSSKCVARSALGEACAWGEDCVAGAYCDTSGTHTCKPQVPLGAACTISDECSSDSCTNGKCKAVDFGLELLCGGD